MQLISVGFPVGADFETILREVDRLQGRGVLRLLDALFVTKNDDGTISRIVIGDDDLGELLAGVVPFDAAALFGLIAADGAADVGPPDARTLVESLAPGAALAAADAIRAEAAADAVRALVEAGLLEDEAFHEAADALVDAGLMVGAARRQVADVAVAASITAGELRVLRYLPSTMTFGVIADKLGISRSAAKERAERAYKKLDVHNRADAVVRARELGVIRKGP